MAVSAHRMDRDRAAEIYRPVQERLTKVEDRLRDLACVDFPFLSEMLAHVYGAAGKRVRPAITLLAASFHPHDEYKLEVMATAVELLHIATLIHDDTVDNSDFRRGRATISSMFGKDIAVLVGDYVFASSATFVCDTGHVGVIRRFSETIMELSSGELMERVNCRNASQTLDDYHNRIYSKTASLFSMAGETGATLSGAPENVIAALKEYALELGMAFQIVDDILDFQGTEEEIGKPTGSDLAHGIMTLPAFIVLERHPRDNPIRAYFNGHGKDDEALLRKAVDLCTQPEIIDTAYSEASRRCDVARKALHTLPKTPSRQALDDLLDYVVIRRS